MHTDTVILVLRPFCSRIKGLGAHRRVKTMTLQWKRQPFQSSHASWSENIARYIEFTNKNIETCCLVMQNILPKHWIFKPSDHKMKDTFSLNH